MCLLPVVERHLRAHAIPASRFGRMATGDPRFVFDLRRGREPRAATRDRVLAHIASASASPVAATREGPHATAL
ncbi:hypothetical protein [Sandarakinorhabdus sp.]|uniref:hypothetical protein n=1 Tax=Sandarakinorhabdus sp. TaxID=1916663 RepID=UPI00333EBB35